MRLLKIISVPLKMLYASLYPVAYAKHLGVDCRGDIVIYGTSYYMFSTEPFLVSLGHNVFISVGVKFICHDGSTLIFRGDDPDLELAAPIKVGNSVFIGAGALILPGVTVGNNCIIGAHAVVTRDVADGEIVAGNPARVVGNTQDFLSKAKMKSLGIGRLSGEEKVSEYKRIFGVK